MKKSSDEEEEEEAESMAEPKARAAPSGEMSEAQAAMEAAKKRHEEEEAEKLKEYEEQRRIQREQEEEELRMLKEKQERRRKEREEEEKQFAERKQAEEDRRKQEDEERKAKLEAEKAKKDEEKKKRQQMMAGLGATGGAPNFSVPQKDKSAEKFDKFGNIVKAKAEMGLTKEQVEEKKQAFLAELGKSIDISSMDAAGIRGKIKELHTRICKLEADKYDLEKRQERQEYDLKELNERQRQINRNKALKKGLDPDAANSRFPPKVATASKYDRQIDRRSYGDRRELFEHEQRRSWFWLVIVFGRPPVKLGHNEKEWLEFREFPT